MLDVERPLALEAGGAVPVLGSDSATPTTETEPLAAPVTGTPGPITGAGTPVADGNAVLEPPGSPGDRPPRIARKSKQYNLAPEIVGPEGYFNTGNQPLNLQQFVGEKVVLVEFFTYSCYNCQNTHPYIKQYHRNYTGRRNP